ncbi:MAG: ATP-binding cassette domain-containing protein [Bacteroidota bacterium]|nr:ATP-binding cassette domain-containing protein [Bacteroidota bacterium]
MKIQLQNTGKKFGREWIFRELNYSFTEESPVVISGSNGSGKSTLLQVISGNTMESEGKLIYSHEGKIIPQDELYKYISYAAPYLELMEDFTLSESISFHHKFKSWSNGLTDKNVLELSGLAHAHAKQLKNFSSGMKQRVRLLLAILSDTPLLLLDEPCSNLDATAMEWYGELIRGHGLNRTIIVCSNQVKQEHFFCTAELKIEDFKPVLKA